MRGHVFLSYTRRDHEQVEPLVKALEQAGVNVWLDNDIRSGDSWWSVLQNAIREASGFIVVLTPHTAESAWVEREIMSADESKKDIIPVLLSGEWSTSVSPMLVTRQVLDLRGGKFEDGFRRLVELIKKQQIPTTPVLGDS
jgi:hypothetical protein